ncbi:MAG TPA: hypothetical protein VFU07_04950 [Candidatus Lumbricidophila sp.]|nr:hypothetical protein [Candidatus Lumbricidophila sp.]
MSTITRKLQAAVIEPTSITVEWDANSNRLRIALAAEPGVTLAVFSNDEMYRVAASAPAGHIWVREEAAHNVPYIVQSLIRSGYAELVREIRDPFDYSRATELKILI